MDGLLTPEVVDVLELLGAEVMHLVPLIFVFSQADATQDRGDPGGSDYIYGRSGCRDGGGRDRNGLYSMHRHQWGFQSRSVHCGGSRAWGAAARAALVAEDSWAAGRVGSKSTWRGRASMSWGVAGGTAWNGLWEQPWEAKKGIWSSGWTYRVFWA